MNELLKFRKVVTGSLSFLLVAVMLTGCSKADTDGLPDGKQPMTFTALVDGLTTTRATADNAWAGGEEVAIRIDREVKKHTAAAGGKLTVASGIEPWYWQKATETKAVEAWHAATYSATKPASFTVAADQSGYGYQQSDMLYADATISYIRPELEFHHLPTKVVVNLKAGDGVTEAEVQSATVSLVGQNLTSAAIADDWSVTKLPTSGSSTIAPNVLVTPTAGFLKTVQAIVVPQVSTASVRFIKVSVGGQEFFYSTLLDFGTGTQHTYNITVKKNGLSVTASGAEAWTGSTTDVTSKEPIAGFADKDLKIGDYYYSDGTWGDGGYRKYADNTTATLPIMPVLTNASGNVRTVVGVVYWVGDIDDPLLKRDHPGCTRGLVVALHPAKQPSASTAATMHWSSSTEKVNDWTNHSDRGANKVDITQDKMQGYANTVALTAYNAQQANANLKVQPIAAIEQYNADNPTPASSSGWYMPSMMELKYVCWGQGNGQGTIGQDLLNGQIAKAGGTNIVTWFHWSSTEYSYNSDSAMYVHFDGGGTGRHVKRSNAFWVRAVFAF